MIVVIFGGTGTLSEALVPLCLADPQIERIRLFSRNEHRQAELAERWHGERIDYLLGDVRDSQRVARALEGATEIYHLAAIKRVEKSEYDPFEAVLTNVLGTRNVIDACWRSDTVEKAIFTSTDKAVEPLNTYGLTKALAEKLFIQANIGKHRVKFAAARYGNVWGSHGSVIERWRSQLSAGQKISVVNGGMTRFFITPANAAEFVFSSMRMMSGGEVFIPKMKAATLSALALAFAPAKQHEMIPPRPGEKLHEKLIADAEDGLVTDIGDRLVRWPEDNLFPVLRRGTPFYNGYHSNTAERFREEELKGMVDSCR